MPSYNCKWPTCNAILPAKGFCPKHQDRATGDQADYDKFQRDPRAKQFYNSARWKNASRTKLAQEPMCERCRKALAAHVHHIRPVQQVRKCGLTHLLYAASNLMSLYIPCHNAVDKSKTPLENAP